MQRFNKLVRDNIPDIIRRNGESPQTRVLDDKEFVLELLKKLHEEGDELADALSVEELADVQEVVDALRDALHISAEELEAAQQQKNATRGSFAQRIYLEGVE